MKIENNPYSKTFYIWNSRSAMIFYGVVTPPHSHNTMQLVFDLGKFFKCKTPETEWTLYNSLIIKENAIHQLDTNDSVQLLIYLDAGSEPANALRSKYLNDTQICPLDIELHHFARPGEVERCLIEPNVVLLGQLIDRILDHLVTNKCGPVVDERVRTIMKILETEHAEKLTVGDLAKKVFLSESRMRALFRQCAGVPLHRYLIWNKIMQAIRKIMTGSSVQDAAADCGFTDSSHFHKLLLQMFGVRPSQFIRRHNKPGVQLLTHSPLKMENRIFDTV